MCSRKKSKVIKNITKAYEILDKYCVSSKDVKECKSLLIATFLKIKDLHPYQFGEK